VAVEFANFSDQKGIANLSCEVIFVMKCYWMGGQAIPLRRLKTAVMKQSVYAFLELLNLAAQVMVFSMKKLNLLAEAAILLLQVMEAGNHVIR
jgi:hypothetical protein